MIQRTTWHPHLPTRNELSTTTYLLLSFTKLVRVRATSELGPLWVIGQPGALSLDPRHSIPKHLNTLQFLFSLLLNMNLVGALIPVSIATILACHFRMASDAHLLSGLVRE